MPITDWPAEDRPREKLLNKGEKMLTDAELIAIFLKSGIRGKTALDIAKELLQEFGGLKRLLRASQQALTKKPGLGNAKYALLKAALELGKRYFTERLPSKTVLNSSKATQSFLGYHLRGLGQEVFACLFMDVRLRLIQYEELFQGTINETNIYPREIVRRGLQHNAAKIILAHNHPSGEPYPSAADKDMTVHIKRALDLVGIEVLDHIIIGAVENYSFADAGLI
jgi:DNA repair protein RadC